MCSKEQKHCPQETLIAYNINYKLKCCSHYMVLLLNVINYWFLMSDDSGSNSSQSSKQMIQSHYLKQSLIFDAHQRIYSVNALLSYFKCTSSYQINNNSQSSDRNNSSQSSK